MDRVMKDKKAILVFILPALLFFGVIVCLPMIYSGYYSLLNWNGVGKGTFIGLGNYQKAMADSSEYFVKSLGNSFIMALLSIFVQVPLALLLTLVIAKGTVRGENFFRTVYFIPVVLSTTVIGQLWMKIYYPNNGLLNAALHSLGLDSLRMNWLGDTKLALGSAFFVLVWQYIGYHMLLMYSSIKAIPPEIYEAASIDGAAGAQVATRITIPLIKPMIKVSVTFALIGSLKTFDLVYVLTKGGPIHATEVPATLIFSNIFLQNRYGLGSAMAIIVLLECLVFTVLLQKVFKTEEVQY